MIKLKDIVNETIDNGVLYHATYRPLLRSIKLHGLDNSKSKRVWDDSKIGYVYLAKDKEVAASYAETSDNVPDSYLDNIVILHIDATKLDNSKLSTDRNVIDNEGDTLEYNGVIPFSYVIKVEDYF